MNTETIEAYNVLLNETQQKIIQKNKEIENMKILLEKPKNILKLPIIIKNLSKQNYPSKGNRINNMINKYVILGYQCELKETEKMIRLKFVYGRSQ